MAGWRWMMAYRSAKRIAKAADVKVLASLSREELKKICGDNFPEWISFPVYEQAGEMVIRESVEPLLEQYRPVGITSLKFSELSLGRVAPKIEGIRVQSLKEGQIIMDIDFRWGGDPSIILGVEAAKVASIAIQLKDLQVFTVVRAIFQLAEEIPCISAVVLSLLSEPKPRIDYTLKVVDRSFTALPGIADMTEVKWLNVQLSQLWPCVAHVSRAVGGSIADMIKDTVTNIVTDMLEWPHRIVVPIGGIPVDISDLELKPQGKLTVTVLRANDLKNKEMIGKSDPYAVLSIRPLFKVKTKVVEDNLNPVWNETFELIAEDKETQSLILEVFDKDIGQDKKLGIVKLPLNDLESEKEKEIELRLVPSIDMTKVKDKKDRGTVTIKVLYHEFNKEEQLAALEAEKKILEERQKLKEAGVIGSTMDALDGAANLVGSGIGLAGSGIVVGTLLGVVGRGLIKAAGFMARRFMDCMVHHMVAFRRSSSITPINSVQENGGANPL